MGWCQCFPKKKMLKKIRVRGQQPWSGSLGMKGSASNFVLKNHGSKHPGDACKLGTPKVEKNPTKNGSFGSSSRQPSDFFLVFWFDPGGLDDFPASLSLAGKTVSHTLYVVQVHWKRHLDYAVWTAGWKEVCDVLLQSSRISLPHSRAAEFFLLC